MTILARRIGEIALAATIGATAVPAEAGATCWAAREVSAAQVREMQTVLMVATLRCHAAGIDIVPDYNGFVGAQQEAIAAANLVIKRHFASTGGGQADYDRFATALANAHGHDETNEATCGEARTLAHDAAAARDALQRVAEDRVFPIALPGGACAAPVTLARADAPTPIVMLAAPPATPAPVTLPSDVTGALTVLARFYSAPPAPAATSAPTRIAAALP